MIKYAIEYVSGKIKDTIRKRPLIAVAGMTLVYGLIYVNLIFPADYSLPKENTFIRFTGILESKTYDFDGKLKSVTVKSESPFKTVKTLCYTDSLDMAIGSKVTVTGNIKYIKAATNPGEFSLKDFYFARHIFFNISKPQFILIKEPRFRIKETLKNLLMRASAKVKKCCPLEYGTINTILFADKTNLPSERKSLYNAVGLSHFLVISGLHISVLASIIYGFFMRLFVNRRISAISGMVVIILYGMFIGFTASVFRAVIMYLLRLLADILKMTYDMTSALAFTFALSVLKDPLSLYDTGFIYSYTAVLSVAFYMAFLYGKFWAFKTVGRANYTFLSPAKRKLPDAIGLPAFLWLSLLPVNLINDHTATCCSVILNVVLTLFTLPILLCALLAALFSILNLSMLAGAADFSFAILLRFMDKICGGFEKISFCRINGTPRVVDIIVYYALLFVLTVYIAGNMSKFYSIVVMLTLPFLLAFPANSSGFFGMLDVGQGDSLVLVYKPGYAIVADCGSSSKNDVGENILVPFLLSKGVHTVSDVYISHCDNDHINGIFYLLENVGRCGLNVKRIVVSEASFNERSENLTHLLKTAEKENIPLITIRKGDKLIYRGLSIFCLWPDMNNLTHDSNGDSLVLLASMKNNDILLCADVGEITESCMEKCFNESIRLLTEDGRIEVLKTAHHGSSSSSSKAFLNDIRPSVSLISVGINNSYGHPHKETLKRLKDCNSKVFRTDECGQITVRFNRKGMVIERYRQ